MEIKFEINYGNDLLNALSQLPQKIKDNILYNTLLPLGYIAAERAKELTPVDWDILRESIHVELIDADNLKVAIVAHAVRPYQPDHPYELYVEFGSAKIAEHAMLRTAIHEAGPELVKGVLKAIEDAIKGSA